MKCKGLVFLIEKVFKESVEEVFSRSLVVFCFKEVSEVRLVVDRLLWLVISLLVIRVVKVEIDY